MSDKTLLVFGCSWAVGVPLPPEQAFGHLLAQQLRAKHYVNLAIPGSSNHRSVLQLLDYTKSYQGSMSDHIAVFSLTTLARGAVIDRQGKVIDLRALGPEDDRSIIKNWLADWSSLQQLNHENHKNIMAMQQICKHYGILDFYVQVWDDFDHSLPGIDQSRILPQIWIHLLGYQNQSDYLENYSKGNNINMLTESHPSAAGHALLADAILDQMQTHAEKNIELYRNYVKHQ
jgi:hypothetical protein